MSTSGMDTESSVDTPPSVKYDSPFSSPSQQVPQLAYSMNGLTCTDKMYTPMHGPFLRIVEQPQDHFRFRYKSEMVGTHGCLLGKSQGTFKAKTHPTVELVNHHGRAIIRCRLAQHDNDDEHPHKLLEDEQDRDVSYEVPEHSSYKVGFAGMGIIHTAKKDVPALLYNKYSSSQEFNQMSPRELRLYCENEAKKMNLNIVRLRFSAHDINTNEEICPPVFSEPIHNMKSASTNDLKICRISRTDGRPRGGDDVYIFVEKVNKKNIRIRFYELSPSGEEVWTANANFLESDVHHQYAIVFRTPQYKDPYITADVKVYIELMRPLDGRTSEPKDFVYKAEQAFKQNKKRKANSAYSSIGSNSGSLKSISDIPAVLFQNSVDHAEENFNDVAMSTLQARFRLLRGEAKHVSQRRPDAARAATVAGACDSYLRYISDSDITLAETTAAAKAGDQSSHGSGGMHLLKIPQIPMGFNSPASDLGDALLTNISATSSPAERNLYENTVLPQVNMPSLPDFTSTELKNIFEHNSSIPPEEKKRFCEANWSAYMDSYSDSLPDQTNAFFHLTNHLRSDGKSKGKEKAPITPPTKVKPVAIKEEDVKPNIDKTKSNTEYSAFYKAEDGLEVKQLVLELCEIIRNTPMKKQMIRQKLEKLFEKRLSNGDAFLHMSLCSNQPTLEYIVKIVYNLDMTHLLNIQNNQAQTILHLAIVNELPSLVSFLVSKGCDPMLEDERGDNAVHYAVMCRQEGGKCGCLDALLAAMKANPRAYDLDASNSERQTALHLAVTYNSLSKTRALLRAGARGVRYDANGRTPLHLAADMGYVDVLRELLDYIKPSDVDQKDGRGYTALQIVCDTAVKEHTLEIVKLLLANQASPRINGKESPWRLAKNKPQIRDLMRKYMADVMDEDDVKSDLEDEIKSEPEDDSGDESWRDAQEGGLESLSAYMDVLATRLDATGAWRPLAERLSLHSLLSWFENTISPSRTLLNYLKESNHLTCRSLAQIFDDIGQPQAADIVRSYVD